MFVKDQYDQFLAYYEKRLAGAELDKFESDLKESEFREEYDSFVESKQAIEYAIGEDLKQSLKQLKPDSKISWFTPKLRRIAAIFLPLLLATFYFLNPSPSSEVREMYASTDPLRGSEVETTAEELISIGDSLFYAKDYKRSLDQWNTIIEQNSDDLYLVHKAERNKVVLLWFLKDPEAITLLDKIIDPNSNHEQKGFFTQKKIKVLKK